MYHTELELRLPPRLERGSVEEKKKKRQGNEKSEKEKRDGNGRKVMVQETPIKSKSSE